MTKLKKSLRLLDVIAICVGAMFSSGFFLLPGLAYAHTGPSVFLAYIVSGILIIPSMLSQAELSTAMPKSGGTYFFLDRAFGPIIGCIGGLGTFFGLILKTAFALIGFGAYLQLYIYVPIDWVAAVLALFFILLNLIGAKESGRFQKVLVMLLVASMGLFILEGLRTITFINPIKLQSQFSHFFTGGFGNFFYTIAFVFVSYAGLTKVASVAEEIEHPDRNIPLGMILSLLITVIIYGLGVFVVVALVPGSELIHDLKPIATAEQYAFHWIDGSVGLILVAAAALSAFASTGNAGILASSRYPLAMAKDKLIPTFFSKLNSFGVPANAILLTGALILLVIFTQSEEGIAKFASAFQLLLFILINSAVIIMRESLIPNYAPGYRSPYYPWVQIFGITASLSLLIYMGTMILVSMLIVIVLFISWFYLYAKKRVVRRGAILHWFARIGSQQFAGLENELWDILKQKGMRKNDPLIQVVSNATLMHLKGKQTFDSLSDAASKVLAPLSNASQDELKMGFDRKLNLGSTPITHGLCMAGLRLVGLEDIHLVIIRCPDTFSFDLKDVHGDVYNEHTGTLALFLLSPEQKANTHLRLMANWMTQAEHANLAHRCTSSLSDDNIRHLLFLRPNETLIHVTSHGPYSHWIHNTIVHINVSDSMILIDIIRNGEHQTLDQNMEIFEGDLLIFLGESPPTDSELC